MERVYSMCLDIIETTLKKIDKDAGYDDIKDYLERKKIEVEADRKKCKDASSEYMDKLIKNLK